MDQQTNDMIKNEIESNEVCLFMKGTPDAPQCGFSMAVTNILKILAPTSIGFFDINNKSSSFYKFFPLFHHQGVKQNHLA